MTTRPLNDCFFTDRERMTHAEAIALLRENLSPVAGIAEVPLAEALNRFAAAEVAASIPVPLHTNAAVDGYAFAHGDLVEAPMPISMRIAAGDRPTSALAPGTAARIFTGAVVPQGADTVAMQEDCEATDDAVRLPARLKLGANCRSAGEDLAAGHIVVELGQRLEAADLAALASIGVAELKVFERLRVGLVSSGNELRRPDDGRGPLRLGEVFDANTPLLTALLSDLPVEIVHLPTLPDQREPVRRALLDAADICDVIISSGGASLGDEDHMLAVLDDVGTRHLWQLAVKPGRPMMFGQIAGSIPNGTLYFGLPGNPVAAMVCFLLYVHPALRRLSGEAIWFEPMRVPLPAAFQIDSRKPDRREFLRGRMVRGDDGRTRVEKFARDGSGLISSLRFADGLIELDESGTPVAEGDPVAFIPFAAYR